MFCDYFFSQARLSGLELDLARRAYVLGLIVRWCIIFAWLLSGNFTIFIFIFL